jgi:hypothetical protein
MACMFPCASVLSLLPHVHTSPSVISSRYIGLLKHILKHLLFQHLCSVFYLRLQCSFLTWSPSDLCLNLLQKSLLIFHKSTS